MGHIHADWARSCPSIGVPTSSRSLELAQRLSEQEATEVTEMRFSECLTLLLCYLLLILGFRSRPGVDLRLRNGSGPDFLRARAINSRVRSGPEFLPLLAASAGRGPG